MYTLNVTLVNTAALELVNTYKDPGWGGVGDGLHTTTRYGKTDEGGAREKSLGVVWRNWHPGPLGFQLVGKSERSVVRIAVCSCM
jgi:hypothetical protein